MQIKCIVCSKIFCLNDQIFSSFIRKPKDRPNSKEKGEEAKDTNAMEIESDLKLPKYTDTEVMMDDKRISLTEFMSRFDKFKVDEVSIKDAEDDICFNSKDIFDESRVVSLIGLKYTEDERTIEWDKRKECYTTDMQLPLNFQELLTGNYGDLCSFFFALHPENINREIVSIMNSARIFVEKKAIKQQLQSSLNTWFFKPEALILEKQSGKRKIILLKDQLWSWVSSKN